MEKFSYKNILLLTAPLMLGTFVQSIVSFTDAIFVSNLGEAAFGGFGNGSIMFIALFMFCRGLADGTQIQIANLNGANKLKEIGALLFNAQIYQLLIAGVMCTLLFSFSEYIINQMAESKAVAAAMIEFIKIRGWGLFFAAQHLIMVALFIGLGRTNIILISAVLIAVCNILLDYLLIEGNGGFPALGLSGAPLASNISECIGFVFLFIYWLKVKSFGVHAYSGLKQNLKLSNYFSLLTLSFPLMLQGVLSLSTWLVFFILVEHKGEAALAAAQNIRYMYFLAFVPIFGFAAATKTIVSNLIGQNRAHDIPKVQRRIVLLSVTFMILIFHGSLLYPETLIRLINQNENISSVVLSDSVYILKFISGSILIFSVGAIHFNSIAGLGKTKVSFLIEVFAILFYLIGCYFLMVKWNWNIKYVWWVEYIYFLTFAIFSYTYLLYYRKKNLNGE